MSLASPRLHSVKRQNMEWRLTQTPYNDNRDTRITVSHRRAQRSRVGGNLSGRFLRVPRIIGGIYVVDLPWASPVELNDSLSLGPRSVFHAGWPVTEGPGRKFFRAAAIERFSSREMQNTRNHSDPLSPWMSMRRDMIAVRKLKSDHERAFFRWVAFEYSHLCARGQSRRRCFPFDSCRRIEMHVGGGLHFFSGQLRMDEDDG